MAIQHLLVRAKMGFSVNNSALMELELFQNLVMMVIVCQEMVAVQYAKLRAITYVFKIQIHQILVLVKIKSYQSLCFRIYPEFK